MARSFLGFGRKKVLSDEDELEPEVGGDVNELNKSESDDIMVSDAETEEWAPTNVAYNTTDLNKHLLGSDEEEKA